MILNDTVSQQARTFQFQKPDPVLSNTSRGGDVDSGFSSDFVFETASYYVAQTGLELSR